MGGELQQVASVDEGNKLHPFGQNLIVQLLDFLVDAFEHRLRIGAFLQHRDP